ncbi:MAG: hypothetical protein QME12_07330 [Nanoarchaeota archaeon]|nr:hypothetical protein [Nanoarchaeota archaeon]
MRLFGVNLTKAKLGHWVQIVFCNAAIENFVSGDNLKKIRHFNDRHIVMEENFSLFKIEEYKRRGVPVIDMTRGQEVPRESVFVPTSQGLLSALQFSRRMAD